MKRYVAAGIAVAVLVCGLAACSESGPVSTSAQSVQPDSSAVQTAVELPVELETFYIVAADKDDMGDKAQQVQLTEQQQSELLQLLCPDAWSVWEPQPIEYGLDQRIALLNPEGAYLYASGFEEDGVPVTLVQIVVGEENYYYVAPESVAQQMYEFGKTILDAAPQAASD